MSPGTRESKRVPTKQTLRVEVKIKPGSKSKPPRVRVRRITLDGSISKVVWYCPDLEDGTKLQIIFPGDPRGPFYVLEEASESGEVRGHGNRGLGDALEQYTYTVRISEISPPSVAMAASLSDPMLGETEQELEGEGEMENTATDPVCPDPPIEIPPP